MRPGSLQAKVSELLRCGAECSENEAPVIPEDRVYLRCDSLQRQPRILELHVRRIERRQRVGQILEDRNQRRGRVCGAPSVKVPLGKCFCVPAMSACTSVNVATLLVLDVVLDMTAVSPFRGRTVAVTGDPARSTMRRAGVPFV